MEQLQSLLTFDEDFESLIPSTGQSHHLSANQRHCLFTKLLGVYSLLVSVALFTVLFSEKGSRYNDSPVPPQSVIIEALPYEIRKVHAHPGSSLSGPPSPEHDEAWAELLRPLFVNVSAEELRHVNVNPQEQLRLFDGGYIASLEVYHHLHCIRRLKWHVYESYYFTNLTEQARTLEENHMNHCIESLRIALMCTSDTSLYTLKWRGEGKRPEPQSSAQRMCTVWKPLEQWALPRALSNNPTLVNPDKLEALTGIHEATH